MHLPLPLLVSLQKNVYTVDGKGGIFKSHVAIYIGGNIISLNP